MHAAFQGVVRKLYSCTGCQQCCITLPWACWIAAGRASHFLICTAICRYGFATCSTLKPTQWSYPAGSINQIPGTATVCGDCRVTPFYDVEEVRPALERHPSAKQVLCCIYMCCQPQGCQVCVWTTNAVTGTTGLQGAARK